MKHLITVTAWILVLAVVTWERLLWPLLALAYRSLLVPTDETHESRASGECSAPAEPTASAQAPPQALAPAPAPRAAKARTRRRSSKSLTPVAA
jgi:hypothetical protein